MTSDTVDRDAIEVRSLAPARMANQAWRQVASWLPDGGLLPDEEWGRRNRAITGVLVLQSVGLIAFALARGQVLAHSLFEIGIPLAAAVVANRRTLSRALRSGVAAFGLIACSTILVHLSGGMIEAHFHFFVMLAVIALYEEWRAFMLAIALVSLHHVTVGIFDAPSVYNHPAAQANPWIWSLIHALMVLAESAALIVGWKFSEQAHRTALKAEEKRADDTQTLLIQNSNALRELNELEAIRSQLMEALHHVAEKERSSLALDLHDGPIQHLTALSYEVDLARLSLDKGDRAVIDDALEVVEQGLSTEIDGLRGLMMNLRPPALDERGLAQALSDLAAAFRSRTNIECHLDVDIPTRLPSQIETVLYRIAQEGLANIAKHSLARKAEVKCVSGDEIRMVISDDGIGFDSSGTDMSGMDGHLGLASIKERVGFAKGRLSIVSAVGKGTRVSVSLTTEGIKDAEVARIGG